MRTQQRLILSALALKDIGDGEIDSHTEGQFINVYTVTLPELFRGLPPIWYFGILPDGHEQFHKSSIIFEARALIKSLLPERRPIVFISDDARMSFLAELKFDNTATFFIDKFELTEEHIPENIKDAPILLSARRQFTNSISLLNPYTPNKPVNDWRFFGRKNEVKKIVESSGNIFLVGARRIGKTSLMQTAQKQLEKQGYRTFMIDCQYKNKVGEVINELANKALTQRDYQYALQTKNTTDTTFLASILNKLKAEKRPIVFFFDEIGNLISKKDDEESWRFIGVLRAFGHNSELRFVVSAFQEIIINQLRNFEGPFVNFGTTLKMYSFKKIEIEEFFVAPLNFWGKIRDRKELANFIKKNYGSHPLILQFLGEKLFAKIINNENLVADALVRDYDTREYLKQFENAVSQIYDCTDYLERYIFLKLCLDIESESSNLSSVEIKQERIKAILVNIGVKSDLDTRNTFLDRLCLRGLLGQDPTDISSYRIDCPIIFHYLKTFYVPNNLLLNYLEEIDMEVLDISKLKW